MTLRTFDINKISNDFSSLINNNKISTLDNIVGDNYKNDFIQNPETKEYILKTTNNEYRNFIQKITGSSLYDKDIENNIAKFFGVNIKSKKELDIFQYKIRTIIDQYDETNSRKLGMNDVIVEKNFKQQIMDYLKSIFKKKIDENQDIEFELQDISGLIERDYEESISEDNFPKTSNTLKLTKGKRIAIGITGIVIAGVLTYQLILKVDGVSSEEITKAAEQDALNASGCYLVNLNTQDSNKIDLLSCNNTTSPSSIPICTKNDKTCEGKFNPCIGGLKIPSQCSKLVVSNISDSSKEVLSCLTNTGCSSYCNIKNFKYDPLQYMMECINFDGNIVKLKIYRNLTGDFSPLKFPIKLKNNSKRSLHIIYGFLSLLLSILLIIKIYKK